MRETEREREKTNIDLGATTKRPLEVQIVRCRPHIPVVNARCECVKEKEKCVKNIYGWIQYCALTAKYDNWVVVVVKGVCVWWGGGSKTGKALTLLHSNAW